MGTETLSERCYWETVGSCALGVKGLPWSCSTSLNDLAQIKINCSEKITCYWKLYKVERLH